MFVNDFELGGKEDKERLNDLIYTHYDSDQLQENPTCFCGTTSGGFFVDSICEVCHKPVTVVTERPLESILWLKPPPGVEVFINLHIWSVLSASLTYGEVNVLRWICDPNATIPEDHKQPALQRLRQLKIERGINSFYRNFDEVFQKLITAKIFKTSRNKNLQDTVDFVAKYRDRIFCKALPMPSKLGFITEHNLPNSYMDPTMVTAVNALLIISSAINSPVPLSEKMMQSYSVKANQRLAEFYQEFISNNLVSKPGLLRKHVAGSRMHFTFRAVISSLSEPHNYRELHLPWSMSVLVFKHHLVAKLLRDTPTRQAMTPNQAISLILENTLRYNPLIDELLQEIITEGKEMGFPVLLGRNPTLTRGSIQKFYVTKIIKDPSVKSIKISTIALVAPNADFDGDALNGTLILDDEMSHKLEAFAPYHGVMDLTDPMTLSRNINIPSPVISTMSAWLNKGRRRFNKSGPPKKDG